MRNGQGLNPLLLFAFVVRDGGMLEIVDSPWSSVLYRKYVELSEGGLVLEKRRISEDVPPTGAPEAGYRHETGLPKTSTYL